MVYYVADNKGVPLKHFAHKDDAMAYMEYLLWQNARKKYAVIGVVLNYGQVT